MYSREKGRAIGGAIGGRYVSVCGGTVETSDRQKSFRRRVLDRQSRVVNPGYLW